MCGSDCQERSSCTSVQRRRASGAPSARHERPGQGDWNVCFFRGRIPSEIREPLLQVIGWDSMRTRPLARLSAALLLVGLLASAGATKGVEVNDSSRLGAELPRAPHRDGEYHNFDPDFRRVSGWIHTRFY